MASSFVVSRNKGKLSHLFFGLQNSRCARLHSLLRARFLHRRLSAEGVRAGHPVASVSLPVLASSSASNALVVSSLSSLVSSWMESNCSFSRVSGQAPNKAGWCVKVGSSKLISLSCCCTKNCLAHLVMPHPLGDHWDIAGWALVVGATAKAFR